MQIRAPKSVTPRSAKQKANLYYYRARYYDSGIGRFLGEDPIGFDGGDNGYEYADNSPNDFIDPSGLSPWGDLLNWYLNKYHPILPLTQPAAAKPCPLAPVNPCDSSHGRPYDPRHGHPARDIGTPGLGTPIAAPEDGSVGKTNGQGYPVSPPFNLSQSAPPGSTNFISINTVSGYNITFFHVTPNLSNGSDLMGGTVVGYTDDTGRQMGAIRGRHTHVQVRDPSGKLIDPLMYFTNCN
jgi:RHS repeat-associated protein